jgi:tRNA(fMet)-specific endonuclease VapC
MSYILDTDTLTHLMRGNVQIARHIANHPVDDISISVITVEEQLSGWYDQLRKVRSNDQLATAYRRLQETTQFLGRINILPFTLPSITRWDQLKKAKLNVRSMDLKIASIALEHQAIVVTRNIRDFSRVTGVKTENWMV